MIKKRVDCFLNDVVVILIECKILLRWLECKEVVFIEGKYKLSSIIFVVFKGVKFVGESSCLEYVRFVVIENL